jgi:hypothetical protein
MIYEANTTQWKRGDVVIHDADEKSERMLMRVTGYGKDGLCRTRYIGPRRSNLNPKQIWENDIKYLHDPARFGIPSNTKAEGRR